MLKFDRYDRRILQELQHQGRLTNQELADRIGLSPSPCLRRVRALEEAGVILGYRAQLSPKALGLHLTIILSISMDHHTPERFEHFEAAIRDMPEVQECLLLTGRDADYQLKVNVRDMDHYQNILINQITRIAGVSGVHSSFVLRTVLENDQLPLS